MLTLLEIFLLFVVPALPGFFDSLPKKYRLHVLAAVFLTVAIIVYIQHWPLSKLGLATNSLFNGLWLYCLFTVLAVIYIIAVAKILKFNGASNWWKDKHFIFGFVLISIGQEFLYRGFLMPELEMVFHTALLVIVINSLLFTFIHAIYPNKLVNLTTSFIGGLCFAGIYYFYPSLVLVFISHMILNFAAVYFGLFSFKDSQAR